MSTDGDFLEELGRGIDAILNREDEQTTGFVLLVFPFHAPSISTYISNGERASMIESMEETVMRLRAGEDNQRE